MTICILGGMQNPSITTAQAFVEFSTFTLTFESYGLGPLSSEAYDTRANGGTSISPLAM